MDDDAGFSILFLGWVTSAEHYWVNSEEQRRQLATLDPPPDSILAGRISLHPDGNRLAVSFVRQHGKIYMLEGFDESTSWFDRPMRRF